MLLRQLTILALLVFLGCGKSQNSSNSRQDNSDSDIVSLPFASVYGQEVIASFFGKCTAILDSDVIEVETKDDKIIRVRMESIDAPELDQPFGECASEYVESSLLGKHIKIAITGKDEFGHSRGWVLVYPNSRGQAVVITNFNALMVKKGYAWHYDVHSDSKMMKDLENQAREARTGLWKDNNPVAPWKWRKRRRNSG